MKEFEFDTCLEKKSSLLRLILSGKAEQLYLFTSVLGHHQVDEEVSGRDSARIYMPPTRQLVGNKTNLVVPCRRLQQSKSYSPGIKRNEPVGFGHIFKASCCRPAGIDREPKRHSGDSSLQMLITLIPFKTFFSRMS